MRKIKQFFACGLVILSISMFIISCASIPELKVNYELPPKSEQLKGKKVILEIVDARKDKEILSHGARKRIEGFSGNLSLSVADYKEKGFKIGIFQVSGLLKEVFRRRLENLGLTVLPRESRGEPQLLIVLKEFTLDLAGQKWVAKMDYEARLTRSGGFMATQDLNGEAERYELVGREGADVVLGEIFTDLVNKLDVVRLFQQVGL